jgi:hypothetical protein
VYLFGKSAGSQFAPVWVPPQTMDVLRLLEQSEDRLNNSEFSRARFSTLPMVALPVFSRRSALELDSGFPFF